MQKLVNTEVDSIKAPLLNIACMIIFIWGLSAGRDFFLPVIIAGFLGFLISPLQQFLTARAKFPDALAVVVSAVILISPLAILGVLLVSQAKGLAHEVPQMISTIQAKLQEFVSHSEITKNLGIDMDTIFQKVTENAGQGAGVVMGGVAMVAGMGSQILLILVFAVLFLASRVHLRRSAEHILAKTHGIDGPHILDQATDLIQKFLVARMAIVAIIGVMGSIALHFLNIQYSAVLGTFFGVMTLVPAIGSITAIGGAVIVALVTGHSVSQTLVMTAILFGISAIENYVLTPKLVGNRLNLNALTCFIGLFAGGLLWGIWGMFLSIPILGVVRIVFAAIPALEGWGELLSDKLDTSPSELIRKPKASQAV
jgi:putative permease